MFFGNIRLNNEYIFEDNSIFNKETFLLNIRKYFNNEDYVFNFRDVVNCISFSLYKKTMLRNSFNSILHMSIHYSDNGWKAIGKFKYSEYTFGMLCAIYGFCGFLIILPLLFGDNVLLFPALIILFCSILQYFLGIFSAKKYKSIIMTLKDVIDSSCDTEI